MTAGWDPLKESLCDYVHRMRVEDHMQDAYDDKRERHLEQKKALCLYWARDTSDPNQMEMTLTVLDENEAA